MKFLIALLTAATGILHLLVGFGMVGDDGMNWLLVINGVGYLVLLVLFWRASGNGGAIRWILLAYALITFIGYFLLNRGANFSFSNTMGLIVKAIELLLILLLFMYKGSQAAVAGSPAAGSTRMGSGIDATRSAGQAVGSSASKAAAGASAAAGAVTAASVSVADRAGNAIAGAVDYVEDKAGDAVDAASDAAGDVVGAAEHAAGAVVDTTKDAVGYVGDKAGEAVDAAADVAGDVAGAVDHAAEAAVDTAGDAVGYVGKKAGDAVDAAADVAGDVAGAAEHAAEAAVDTAGDAVGYVGEKAGDAVDAAADVAGDVAGAAERAAEAAVDTTKDAVGYVGEKAGEAVDAVSVDVEQAAEEPGEDEVRADLEEYLRSFGPSSEFRKPIEYIEGIGAVYGQKLRSIEINTVMDLVLNGATRRGRKQIADQSGIAHSLILTWVNHVDLFRIKGVAEEYADLLEQSGVDTVMELAQRNPANLYKRMKDVNEQKSLVRRIPHASEVESWVQQAKGLRRLIYY